MIIYKRDNLIELAEEGHYDVILHGANCFCKMDDGIALQFAEHFPEILHADLLTISQDKTKLGTYTTATVKRVDKEFEILNCYVQYAYAGYDIEISELFDYEAYERVLKTISVNFKNKKIGMPLIGTGHAGGDLDRILDITEKILKNNNVEIIIFSDRTIVKQYSTIKNYSMLYIQQFYNFFHNQFKKNK